jgi:S-DNA-T family DNA segregation ATPase FtsK/SpoIIIE
MSIVISMYSKKVFKEFVLPSLNNADYSITLEKEDFELKKKLILNLEVLDDQWKIKSDVHYLVKRQDYTNYQGEFLKNQDVLVITTENEESITVIVKEAATIFHSYEKFRIQNTDKILIGKDQRADIRYNYKNYVSSKHAIIEKKADGFWIRNESLNGIYVNSSRIDTEAKLSFGDYINIMGLHMVFLNTILAIDVKENELYLNVDTLKPCKLQSNMTVHLKEPKNSFNGKILYHRAPRNYERLVEGPIEIEEPPEKTQTKQQPLFLTIGPSVTMALPMLLGCMMMIYASQSEGGNSSLYMYSGLVMSFSSAFIGVMWALFNIRYQKKQDQESENYRFQAYSKYLIEKKDEIKEKYDITKQMLEEMYPEAEKCLNYNQSGGILWNRNRTHEDYLIHRLGIGDIPFQVEIQIPKKRFRLYEDDLSNQPDFIKENYDKLYEVPVTIDFIKNNLIGIVGGNDKAGALEISRIMSTQIAANNCYTDVKLGYLYDGSEPLEREAFQFAKWLPHTWSEDKKTRFLASNKEEASDVLYDLTKVLRMRSEEGQNRKEKEIPKPYYILFISDASLLEGELFSKYAFEKNEQYGMTVILLVERYEELPNHCEFIIQNDHDFHGMYDVFAREDEKVKIDFDTISEEKLMQFSRNLAKLEVQEMEEGGEIPSSLTFFDMFGVNKLEELPIKELWTKNRIYENIKGMIGQKAGGAPCYLDVHEKYHGPHGLVAGTTGSGKSETLQTYMLSLAVNYSPDDVGFFIIDYKGGGMANLFEGLPHMIGQISNLSGNQVKRAMVSIKSENRRRQRVFNENGVNNINSYTKLYKNGEAILPVPHLFIIIDEFAELKREEPDFMKELISVAQVGRSLGVHLILATQKPSGTVDDNIWSNSKFRLCLRVQDKQDSNDMLHRPDAAYITQAGRCYLQVGNDEIYELFQSGYSGAVYDKNAGEEKTDIAKLIRLNGKVEMTGNMAKASKKKKVQYAWIESLIQVLEETAANINVDVKNNVDNKAEIMRLSEAMYPYMEKYHLEYSFSSYNTERLTDFILLYEKGMEAKEADLPKAIIQMAQKEQIKLPEGKEKTQLEAVKEYLGQIARENGYQKPSQLWMPVLPEKIYLDDFEEFRKEKFENGVWKKKNKNWSLEILLGKVDDPANQNQMPLNIDFAVNGHMAICGNIVSGKSTMMQTMIYALIEKYTPKEINIYGLDFSSKMMSAFEEAPQIGGIMYENDMDKIGKFFNMMNSILEERKMLFRGGNYSQYVQVNGVILPAIVIFVDNYIGLKEKTAEIYEEQMVKLSKEGVSHGIYLVVSGAGFGMNDITQRVGENMNTILCLNLQDKYVYADMLHTTQFDVLPESGVKGRGLALVSERVLEYQTALALEAENDYERIEKIKVVCKDMAESWDGRTARKVPEIPEKPVWSQFVQLEEFEAMVESKEYLPVGYDAANASVYGIPLRNTYCYLIWGRKASGKTNFMKIALQVAMRKESNIYIIDDERESLKGYKDRIEVSSYVTTEEELFQFLMELKPEFVRRNQLKQQLLHDEYEEEEIFDRMSEEIPYFIFVSDLSNFISMVYGTEYNMSGFVENIIEKGFLHNIYFIGELSLEKREKVAGYGAYEHFAEYKTGIHFGGKVSDNQVLTFDYLSYMEQGKSEKKGIGQLPDPVEDNETQKVVVPFVKGGKKNADNTDV